MHVRPELDVLHRAFKSLFLALYICTTQNVQVNLFAVARFATCTWIEKCLVFHSCKLNAQRVLLAKERKSVAKFEKRIGNYRYIKRTTEFTWQCDLISWWMSVELWCIRQPEIKGKCLLESERGRDSSVEHQINTIESLLYCLGVVVYEPFYVGTDILHIQLYRIIILRHLLNALSMLTQRQWTVVIWSEVSELVSLALSLSREKKSNVKTRKRNSIDRWKMFE